MTWVQGRTSTGPANALASTASPTAPSRGASGGDAPTGPSGRSSPSPTAASGAAAGISALRSVEKTSTTSEPVWVQIAELLCGGAVGFALLDELRVRFPHAKRDDVYRAVATAWTYQQAGWLADVCESEGL